MKDGKITHEDVLNGITLMIDNDGFNDRLSAPISMDVGMPITLPLKRETKKVYDAVSKSVVTVYKDDIQKQIYGHLTEHLYPSAFKPNN